MKLQAWWLIYGLLAVLTMVAGVLEPRLGVFPIAFLMPTLALAAFRRLSGLTFEKKYWLLASLLFAWAGDVLLALKVGERTFFVEGLGAFLLAQLCYAVIFFQSPRGFLRLKQSLCWVALACLWTLLLLGVLIPRLGDMQVPVIIYGIGITSMALGAASRRGQVSSESYQLTLGGAFLFLGSDSLIAVNRFLYPIPFHSVPVMITYALGQAFIVEGLLREAERQRAARGTLS